MYRIYYYDICFLYACIKLVFAAYMLTTQNLKALGKTGLPENRIPCNSGATCPSVDLFYYAKPEKIESGVLV